MKPKYLVIVLIFLIILLGFSYYHSLYKIPEEKEEISLEKEEYIIEDIVEEEKEEIKEIIFEKPKEKEAIVTIEYLKFIPNELNITPGTTVVWINKDTRPHQIYANIPGTPFFSGRLQPGDKYEYTFNDLGVYRYRDGIFKSIQGKIRVIETLPITGSFIGPPENQSFTGILMILVIFIFLGSMFEICKEKK